MDPPPIGCGLITTTANTNRVTGPLGADYLIDMQGARFHTSSGATDAATLWAAVQRVLDDEGYGKIEVYAAIEGRHLGEGDDAPMVDDILRNRQAGTLPVRILVKVKGKAGMRAASDTAAAETVSAGGISTRS